MSLFARFDRHLEDQGLLAWGMNASIVKALCQRNTQDETARLERCPMPGKTNPSRFRQKD
ncbi:MAG: hypothetical protein HRT36_07290 [Alphaproteobacteria bacterium]|nr:hypothetical protein [Alphaproteobacteria bacterium]